MAHRYLLQTQPGQQPPITRGQNPDVTPYGIGTHALVPRSADDMRMRQVTRALATGAAPASHTSASSNPTFKVKLSILDPGKRVPSSSCCKGLPLSEQVKQCPKSEVSGFIATVSLSNRETHSDAYRREIQDIYHGLRCYPFKAHSHYKTILSHRVLMQEGYKALYGRVYQDLYKETMPDNFITNVFFNEDDHTLKIDYSAQCTEQILACNDFIFLKQDNDELRDVGGPFYLPAYPPPATNPDYVAPAAYQPPPSGGSFTHQPAFNPDYVEPVAYRPPLDTTQIGITWATPAENHPYNPPPPINPGYVAPAAYHPPASGGSFTNQPAFNPDFVAPAAYPPPMGQDQNPPPPFAPGYNPEDEIMLFQNPTYNSELVPMTHRLDQTRLGEFTNLHAS